jgi:hypothetical protein
MAYRELTARDGVVWKLWEVHPTIMDRRVAKETVPSISTAERRKIATLRYRLPGPMSAGWLAMLGGTERRRIAPIPEGWERMTDEELLELMSRASVTAPMRRLLD